MTTTTNKNTVSMMELRNQPGTVLDRVFYRNESFIVEKSGEARAAIVPVREYQELQRRKRQARERFFALSDEIKKRTNQYDPQEVQAAIDEAVEAVRRENKSS